MEIERKFRVVLDAWRADADEGAALRQFYVLAADDRSARVRIKNDKSAKLTLKFGKAALSRHEYEYDIPLDQAEAMMAQALGVVIEKRRYIVPYQGFDWEVDVYDGALAGLVIAEVEMASEADDPPRPGWVGEELTGDRRFTNQVLALEGWDRS